MQTKVIDNFTGRLTRYKEGDLNSGFAKYGETFGNDPFSNPGSLSWFENPSPSFGGGVITDLVMAMKTRLESGITYVYAIGHTGRLYKIQANDPSTYDPNYDNAVLLTTLTSNSPTFKYGSSIQFYGATEKMFIGHDKGVTKVNFDGTGETFVGVLGSYTQNVPRPSVEFNGKLYFGNGTNLVEIDSTELVTTYSKLSPALPSGTQIRDIDVSPDGNYVQIVSSRISQADMTTLVQDTSSLSSADSYLFSWNGIDKGYNSYTTFPSYSINSNTSYGPYSYTIGYDFDGLAIYSGGQKKVTLQNCIAPNFGAVFSVGNLLGFVCPYSHSDGTLRRTVNLYGKYDDEIPEGLFRASAPVQSTGYNIIQMPSSVVVSNLFYGASTAGYTDNIVGSNKIYFSALENQNGVASYQLYRFSFTPSGEFSSQTLAQYETQTQIFSKRIKVSQVRVYFDPAVTETGSAAAIYLVGADGQLLGSGAGSLIDVITGQQMFQYNPEMPPTYNVAVRVLNGPYSPGETALTINKIEIDYTDGGI